MKNLSDANLGLMLSKEMQELAGEVAEDPNATVSFFEEDEEFGFEVTCDGKQIEVEDGYDTLLDAIGAFTEWVDRHIGDDDDDDDD